MDAIERRSAKVRVPVVTPRRVFRATGTGGEVFESADLASLFRSIADNFAGPGQFICDWTIRSEARYVPQDA